MGSGKKPTWTEINEVRDQLRIWDARFREGLLYDAERNVYTLVWTEEELAQARARADKLMRFLGVERGQG